MGKNNGKKNHVKRHYVRRQNPVRYSAENLRSAYKGTDARRWQSVYAFVPVFETLPEELPTAEEVQKALSQRLGHVEPSTDPIPDELNGKNVLAWELWEHMTYDRKEMRKYPTQLVMAGPGPFNQKQWNERMIVQFWGCGEDRKSFAERCQYSYVCSNMMTANLPRRQQYRILADFADAMLDLFPECIGIYWPHSQNLVSREYFQEPHWYDPSLHFLDGGLNVRMFRINEEELLFDTLGLTAIGLPDLQFHCKNQVVPNEVVLYLKNLASYLYTKGDVIKDGSVVESMDKEDRWVCKREGALMAPYRMVLDVCPGDLAAGERE